MADPSISELFSSHFLSTLHLHFSTLADRFFHSLNSESFIYLGFQQRQTTGTASMSLLLIEVLVSAYRPGLL